MSDINASLSMIEKLFVVSTSNNSRITIKAFTLMVEVRSFFSKKNPVHRNLLEYQKTIVARYSDNDLIYQINNAESRLVKATPHFFLAVLEEADKRKLIFN